jgi:hypothetical protein
MQKIGPKKIMKLSRNFGILSLISWRNISFYPENWQILMKNTDFQFSARIKKISSLPYDFFVLCYPQRTFFQGWPDITVCVLL